MITICITIGVVALIVCATICFVYYERYLSDIDSGDISKLEDIHVIVQDAILKEADARMEYEEKSKDDKFGFYFDNKAYKDAVYIIYKITENYKNE